MKGYFNFLKQEIKQGIIVGQFTFKLFFQNKNYIVLIKRVCYLYTKALMLYVLTILFEGGLKRYVKQYSFLIFLLELFLIPFYMPHNYVFFKEVMYLIIVLMYR
jgi:hypothetical protein